MMEKNIFSKKNFSKILMSVATASLLFTASCKKDDPEPVNEEEVITTFTVTLTPNGSGSNVIMKFFDEDGSGSIAPVKTVTGSFTANKTYTGVVTIANETVTPVANITEEVEEESGDHLLCYTVNGANITVAATDHDANGLPVGLNTTWSVGAAGNGSVKIVLRHQPGVKTGDCPGAGDSDVEVEFNFEIE